MQTIVQLICSRGPSLRDLVVNDSKLAEFGLAVRERLNPRRRHGWAKIRSTRDGRSGAVNIEWDGDARILLCRVVNRRRGRPELILGDLVAYLVRRHRRRITALNVIPRG
jgi:hypothetical protein